MLKLDMYVPLVTLIFRFNSLADVPSCVAFRAPVKNVGDATRPKRVTSGEQKLELTPMTSVEGFLAQIEAAGYEMVSATCKEEGNPSDPFGMKRVYVVRYLFALHEDAEVSDEFKAEREDLRQEFVRIGCEAFWSARVFLNPYREPNGEPLAGLHTVSINLTNREARTRPDGELVTRWPHGSRHRQVGDRPLPIAPEHRLLIGEGGELVLAPASEER